MVVASSGLPQNLLRITCSVEWVAVQDIWITLDGIGCNTIRINDESGPRTAASTVMHEDGRLTGNHIEVVVQRCLAPGP